MNSLTIFIRDTFLSATILVIKFRKCVSDIYDSLRRNSKCSTASIGAGLTDLKTKKLINTLSKKTTVHAIMKEKFEACLILQISGKLWLN